MLGNSTLAWLTPALTHWISYAVLTGYDDQAICTQLSSAPTEELAAYLQQLRASPLLTVGQDFARQLGQLRWLLDLQKEIQQVDPDWNEVPTIRAEEHSRFFKDFLVANRPVLIDGLLEDWPAVENWNHQGLKERLGHCPIEYTRYVTINNRHEPEKQKAQFGDFLDLVYDENYTDPIYWTAYNQEEEEAELLRGLRSDIRFPKHYCEPNESLRTYFWIGPEGTRSGLHFDPYNVLFVQVKGKKRMLLLPPQDIPNVYLKNDYFSQVDGENPDTQRFPKYAQTTPRSVVVEEGQALLIPVGWLHQVRSLSPSFSVSITCLKMPSGTNSYTAPSEYRGVL